MAAKPAVKPPPAAQLSAERGVVIITDPVRHDGEDLDVGATLELERGPAERLIATGAAEWASAPEGPPPNE